MRSTNGIRYIQGYLFDNDDDTSYRINTNENNRPMRQSLIDLQY